MRYTWFWFLLLTVGLGMRSLAQDSCTLQISVMTCGTGQELYSSYGHSAIRVVDPCKGTDSVYNYGGFNFAEPDFYMKFTRGKLKYYLFAETMESFLGQYVYEGRSVIEQRVQLNEKDAQAVQQFLRENLKEANRYYRYDFLFDNCSTRIRDLFQQLFQNRLRYLPFMASDSIRFRTLLNHYERNLHWERVGINLLMSHVVDQKMSSYQSMFLPDYLLKGLAVATLDGHALIADTKTILVSTQTDSKALNQPLWIFWSLFVGITFLSLSKKMRVALIYIDVLLFLVIGLLGCLMMFMWFGTEHQVCERNLNLLWAFPLHIVFAFLIARQSAQVPQYAKYASWLLMAGVAFSFFADQKYFGEIIPLILLLFFRLNHYSKSLKFSSP